MKPHVAEALGEELARRGSAPDFDHLRLDARGRTALAGGTVHRGAVLRTPDGDLPVERIGKGAFSAVYRERGGDRVFALSDDDVFDKEIAAMVHGDKPENPHVPAVEKFGHTGDKTVYAMPHYRTPLRKKVAPQAWEDYGYVKKCYEGARAEQGYPRNSEIVDCVQNSPAPEALGEALAGLKDWAANYSDQYSFEFSPKNLASDPIGNLVLLDVLFDKEQLRKRRRAQEQKREQGANIAGMYRHFGGYGRR